MTKSIEERLSALESAVEALRLLQKKREEHEGFGLPIHVS